MVLWYRLVGCKSYYWEKFSASGLQWYVDDSPHLYSMQLTSSILEQARWVKTVNIHIRLAKIYVDKTVGCFQEQSWKVIAIDWVTCRSARITSRVGLMYSQATTSRQVLLSWSALGEWWLMWSGGLKIETWEAWEVTICEAPGKILGSDCASMMKLVVFERFWGEVKE